ncbi:MAG: NAD(P)/FAD-dependent oxidoreductase [Bacilli bacterium]
MGEEAKLSKILNQASFKITFEIKDNILFLYGETRDYQEVLTIIKSIEKAKMFEHVVNKIKIIDYVPKVIHGPQFKDETLNNKKVDVLVIGGGVVGCAIIRELSKYNLKVLLVEKEEDVALQASSRNDGCIHAGIDLKKNSNKLKYLNRAKEILPELCEEIGIEYVKSGQTVCFKKRSLFNLAKLYIPIKAKQNHLKGCKVLPRKELLKIEPNLSKEICGGIHFADSGTICPYNFTIALAESAVMNGAQVSLNTIVNDMEVKDNIIKKVYTNRGVIIPKIVVNAAGVFADTIASMAEDEYFSIHPRKGTDIIMDKSAFSSLSRSSINVFSSPLEQKKTHTKGGGIIPTVDNNSLIGPDAIEILDKEDFSTTKESINNIINKHKNTINNLNKSDIITYFSGVRAPTFEEDFIVEQGKWTKNIVHAAGIQSPGLTAAPAIAEEICNIVTSILEPSLNKKFNPIRKGYINTRKLSLEERDQLIKSNPKYGRIICRCEEISEGEILDVIHSPIVPTTIDGIKRRCRAGMGRCQGVFCQPLVHKILAQELNINLEKVNKKGNGNVLFSDIKEGN